MYESVCPDIFKGGKERAVAILDDLKITDEVSEFMESTLNLSADYAWIMVALSKLYNGDDLGAVVKEKWEAIQAQKDGNATASEKAATDTPTLYSYWKTIHNTCEQYIKLSMDNIGTDTIYHPYGFVHFLAMSVRIAYDLFSFLSRDADGNFDLVREYEDDIFKAVSESVVSEYEHLMKLRLSLTKEMEVVVPDSFGYNNMFTNDMSIREYRSMLLILINIDMLKRTTAPGLDDLIRAIQDGGMVDVIAVDRDERGHSRRKREMPDDIKGMFDD